MIFCPGVTGNGWYPPWSGGDEDITPITGNGAQMPCGFRDLKGQNDNIRTGSFYDWNWIRHLSNRGFPGDVDKEIYAPEDQTIADWYVVGNATGNHNKSKYKLSTVTFLERAVHVFSKRSHDLVNKVDNSR